MKETVVIFQCCKKKSDVELYPDDGLDLTTRIPKTNKILENAVMKFD